MADVRLYILAGTFLAVVVTLIWFVVALVRARRHARQLETYHNTPAAAPGADDVFDANLEGLNLVVASDAPSASLLTPLRTGDWQPEDRSLSPELLQGVALDQRIDTYQPAPNVPEPSFNVQAYQPWEVAEPAPVLSPAAEVPIAAPQTILSAPPTAPATEDVEQPKRPLAELVPQVGVEVPTSGQALEEPDLELEEEIAALLPHGLDDDLAEAVLEEVEPAEAPSEALAQEAARVAAPEAAAEPTPEAAAEPTPEAAEISEPEPIQVREPQLTQPPEAEEPVSLDEAFGEMGWNRPSVTPSSREPTAIPQAVVHTAEEPTRPTAPVEGVEPVTPRPAVKVTSAEPPKPQEPVAPPPAKPAKPRPIVTVGGTAYAPTAAIDTDEQRPRREEPDVPELVMLAPVEMWFGDSRVGVKEGSATYDRFRKYADVLFEDLKASRASSR